MISKEEASEAYHFVVEGDESIPDYHKKLMTTAIDNVIESVYAQYQRDPVLADTLDSRILIAANFRVIVHILKQLSPLINIQPLGTNVGIIKTLKYVYGDDARLSLCAVDVPVEAYANKSSARFVPYTAHDLYVSIIDIECDIARSIAKSACEDIIFMVLNDILHAHSKPTFTTITADMLKIADGQMYPQFEFELNKAGSDIAHKTRRGAGNILVTSPEFLKYLRKFELIVDDNNADAFDSGSLTHIGKMFNCMQVYCTPILHDEIIIGYNGDMYNQVDGSYCYVLNQPLIYNGASQDPWTFEPVTSFKHKFAKNMKDREHYRVLKVEFPVDNL